MGLTRVKYNQVDTKTSQSVVDSDIKAIGDLADNSGLLRKTGVNTWTLDNSTFLTAITSADVIGALGFTPHGAQITSAIVPEVSGTTTVTLNNSIPTMPVGSQVWSSAITPSSASNKILIEGAFTYCSGTASRQLLAFVFRDSVCIGVTGAYVPAASTAIVPIVIRYLDSPNSTTSITYSIRVAGTSAHTWYINRFATSRFSGTMAQSIVSLREVL